MRFASGTVVKANKVYRYFRDAILKGRLEPGTYLRERDLAARFHVSRTPVREALRQLERDGHVRLVPHVGAQVKEVSLQDLFEVLEIRRRLEPYAARIAAQRATPAVQAELRAIRKAFGTATRTATTSRVLDRHIAADRRLHGLVLELAGNRRIAQIITNLSDTIQRYRYFGIPHRFHRSAQEHLDIVDALLRQDPAAADAAMARHLEQFTQDMQRLLLAPPDPHLAGLPPARPLPCSKRRGVPKHLSSAEARHAHS